jgi:hypothetical protein
MLGWRGTLILTGTSGIVIGVLANLLVKEPKRSDEAIQAQKEVA